MTDPGAPDIPIDKYILGEAWEQTFVESALSRTRGVSLPEENCLQQIFAVFWRWRIFNDFRRRNAGKADRRLVNWPEP